MTTTTLATLLDHVSAYAAAVRAALRDLPPDQVDELTDGLEADLAEALEDREGPVVTGEIPLGRLAAAAGATPPTGSAAMIDLTRRFGPAADYAAELRTAAGLASGVADAAPAATGGGAVGLARVAAATVVAAVSRVRASVTAAGETPAGRLAVSWLSPLRPLWWLVRGWTWWVGAYAVLAAYTVIYPLGIFRFVPRSGMAWAALVAFLVLSVAVGRGLGRRRRWGRALVVAASALALVWLPSMISDATGEVRDRLAYAPVVEYVEVPAANPQLPPQEGVYVDGMQVSNLFVYDADGDPLQGVQIFDDRGRPVRTTFDGGWTQWALPGVSEPWSFAPALDGDGRNRWNVYPLMGAPASAWDVENPDGGPVLLEGEELRSPPPPFAKAPAVVVGGQSTD